MYLLVIRFEKKYEEEIRKILFDICEQIEEDYDEDDDWDYDEDDDEEEDYNSEPGDEKLPSQEEEDLAASIATDIDDGKYSISTIVGLYPQDIVDRIKYLID